MKIPQSINECLAALICCVAMAGSANALHPQHMQGYNAYAGAYPYQYGQGQPPTNWAAPPMVNEDYGGTCCGPRWFDFAVDAVFMVRTGTGFGSQAITSLGIRGEDPPRVVMAVDDLDFDWKAGVRATVRHQFNAVDGLEAVYLDGINWDDAVRVTSDNHDLYSAFSDFGNLSFSGFAETDQASVHELSYRSDMDSVEVNWRHGFMKPGGRHSGAFLIGARYVKLDERMGFHSEVQRHEDTLNNGVIRDDASLDYVVNVDNDLVGAQIGCDFVTCLFPSMMIGSEIKGGVYGNSTEQNTNITSITDITRSVREEADDDDVSFLVEANVYGLIQFHPLWKARIGYQAMYLSDIAVAADNLNTEPFSLSSESTFVGSSGRAAIIDNDGEAFYHGAYLGLEFGW